MSEERFRRAFRELRERETSSIPSFGQLLERDPKRRRPSVALLWIPAAAILLLIVLVVLPVTRAPFEEPSSSAPPVALGDWKSPTDFLLETPAADLLESTPVIPEPVPDYSDALSDQAQKGASS